MHSECIAEPDKDALIYQVAELIPHIRYYPPSLTSLVKCLIRPDSFTFNRIIAIIPFAQLIAGLSASAPAVNMIALQLLRKAGDNKSDSDIVAGNPELVTVLVNLWLCTPETGVAEMAQEVLLALLVIGGKAVHRRDLLEESLIWRRLFRDKDVYGSIFALCSLKTIGQEGQLSKNAKTVSQARLLGFLPKIDSEPIRNSQFPEVESEYGVIDGGLLKFATLHMVQLDDILMHVTFIDFMTQFLSPNKTRFLGLHTALQFLIDHGLHRRVLSYYVEPRKHSALDINYLYGPSAGYISMYSLVSGKQLLGSIPNITKIVSRLSEVLEAASAVSWTEAHSPTADLRVLTSLPRVTLLPNHEGNSPLFLIPLHPPNPHAYRALSAVFRGPSELYFGPANPHTESMVAQLFEEKSAARALYFLYLHRFPDFWVQTIKAANSVALPEVALAAIEMINSVVTANWRPLAQDLGPILRGEYTLFTEKELAASCNNGGALPESGFLSIIESGRDSVLPYLMQPAKKRNNVAGRAGERWNVYHKVAVAKHDLLVQFQQKLNKFEQQHPSEEAEDFAITLARRIALGPAGGIDELGGSVGVLGQ